MSIRSNLLAGVSMTASERAQGRFMRAPEGHGDAAPTPAAPAAAPDPTPSPTPAPAEDHGAQDDFSAFEDAVDNKSKPESAPAIPDTVEDEGDSGTPDPVVEETPADPVAEAKQAKEAAESALAESRAERDRARDRELDDLRREVAKMRDPKDPKGKQPVEGAEPNPDNYDFGTADTQYMLDKAEWNMERKFEAREQEADLRRGFSEMETNWKTQTAPALIAERYPDFQQKVNEGAAKGAWKLSVESSIMVRSSTVGADVAYHLASNPQEAAEIAQMSVVEQAQALGRIEGRFMGQAQASPKSNAPAPPRAPAPPKNTARGAGGRFKTDPSTDDFAAFEKDADKILAQR